MSKRCSVWSVVILLFLILIGVTYTPAKGFVYVHIWQASFSGSLMVVGNQSYPVSTRWDYINNNTLQTCELITLDITLNNDTIVPTDLVSDADGNSELILNLTTPMQQNDILSWREEWRFTVSEQRQNIQHLSIEQSVSITEIEDIIGEQNYHRYTQGTNLWKITNLTLTNLATDIQENLPENQRENALSLVFAAIEWIHHNINRTILLVEPQYPEELLVSRIGDCDDQSNLLIALLRIYGIPSYLMTGHWYQEGASTNRYLWGSVSENAFLFVNWKNVLGHGWTMVYIPPWGWLPFDLSVENIEISPANAYSDSLFAKGLPMVSLWRCISSDYIGEQRSLKQDIFDYHLHLYDFETWTTLGTIPILDFFYFAINVATIIALAITLVLLSCLVGISMRRQPQEDNS
ncbi:MAG: transglutaminase family protein [Promethearchaeota archaeon]